LRFRRSSGLFSQSYFSASTPTVSELLHSSFCLTSQVALMWLAVALGWLKVGCRGGHSGRRRRPGSTALPYWSHNGLQRVGSPSATPGGPARISMLQTSYRGSRRSRVYGRSSATSIAAWYSRRVQNGRKPPQQPQPASQQRSAGLRPGAESMTWPKAPGRRPALRGKCDHQVRPNSFLFCSQETSTCRSDSLALSRACSSEPLASGRAT